MVSVASVSSKEARHRLPVLIVAPGSIGSQFRQLMMNVGFTNISSAPTFSQGLVEAKEGQPSLILFDIEREEPSISGVNFVEYIKKLVKSPLLIAISLKPNGETMFQLLKAGTHGFIIPPFSAGAIEDVFVQIQEGVELGPEILQSNDRSATFARLIREHLDRVRDRGDKLRASLATKETLTELFSGLKGFVRMARFFCETKESPFMDRVHQEFIEYATMLDVSFEKSRLRRIREQLKEKRSSR